MILMASALLSYRPWRGLQLQVITSDSMQPGLPKGSLIVTYAKPIATYYKGDVVTYHAPLVGRPLITHRLVRVFYTPKGGWLAVSKGDANSQIDGWSFSLGAIVGKVILQIPWLGYLLFGVRSILGFLLITLIFLIFFVFPEVYFISQFLKTALIAKKSI